MTGSENKDMAVRKNKTTFSTISIMISSRCIKKFDGTPLSEIRGEIKDVLEEKFLGEPIFDVWINEDDPPQGGLAFEKCLDQARKCDIFFMFV